MPSINVAVSPAEAVVGQTVTVTVTVSGPPDAPVPTGRVQLAVNGPTYASPVNLVNGAASFTLGSDTYGSILFVGPNTIQAFYTGDQTYGPKSFTPQQPNLEVIPALAVAPATAVFGQMVMFTATIGAHTQGTVSFYDGTVNLTPTPVPIINGQAVFSAPSLAPATHTVTAVATVLGLQISSGSVPLIINKGATATSLGFSQNANSVVLTASVSPISPAAGTPTGPIRFLNNGALLGTAALTGSQATLAASNFAGTVTAVYGGDGNFLGSNSQGASIDALAPSQVAVSVSATPNPSTFGQLVTFAAALKVESGNGTPTGTVSFFDGDTPLGSSPVVNGGASVTSSTLAVGPHTIVAKYSGDAVFPAASVSAGQVVTRIGTSLTLSATPSQSGVTVTAQLGPAPPPGVAGPTGQITFQDGGTVLGKVAVSNGNASFPAANLSIGPHQLTASYGGDTNWSAVSSSVSLTVSNSLTLVGNASGNAFVGSAYSAAFTVTGGAQPYQWSITGLPSGVSADNSGNISGTPTTTGDFTVSVQVTDSNGLSTSTSFDLTVGIQALTITASLPAGVQNADYSGSISASGGVPFFQGGIASYTIAVNGLPSGLMASGGAISGQSAVAGTFTLSVQVTDSAGTSASQQFSLVISQVALAISTPALSGAAAGSPYSQSLVAIGGTPPYTWSGSLPAGLSIDAGSGVVSGTPAAAGMQTISVTVTDNTGATASQSYTVTFTAPSSVPGVTITGIGNTAPPATQTTLGLAVSDTYPLPITVTLTLTFQPDTGKDSGEVVFASGGRTTTVTIPANSTNIPVSSGIQTGTVAGLITITATLQTGNQDITPSPAPSQQVRINAVPPVIASVQATRSSSGITVLVTGYSTTREVSQAIFHFNPSSGGNLQTTDLTLPASALFAPWLSGTQVLGSQFLFTQAFTVTGDPQAVASIAVTLVNSQGNSQSATATIQ